MTLFWVTIDSNLTEMAKFVNYPLLFKERKDSLTLPSLVALMLSLKVINAKIFCSNNNFLAAHKSCLISP